MFSVIAAACICVSCAIQYNTIEDNSDVVPEFILKNATVSRYENSVLRVSASAAQIEQYKQKNIYYAEDVSCAVFAEDGALQTEGSFGFVAADTDNEVYTLFDSITVDNHAENTGVRAESLKWSGKTGLLASGADSIVSITRISGDSGGTDDTADSTGQNTARQTSFTFSGRGFSADTFKRTYTFTGISGIINSGE